MRRAPCPTCRRDTAWDQNPWRPFCSERCKMLDLSAWDAERYRIPGDPLPDAPTPAGDDDDTPPHRES